VGEATAWKDMGSLLACMTHHPCLHLSARPLRGFIFQSKREGGSFSLGLFQRGPLGVLALERKLAIESLIPI
jgi:hypothetical protein